MSGAEQHNERLWEAFLEHIRNGRMDEASRLCRAAADEMPTEACWQLGLAWIESLHGKRERATERALGILDDCFDDPGLLRVAALVLLGLDVPLRALQAAVRAFELEPSEATRHLLRRCQEEANRVTENTRRARPSASPTAAKAVAVKPETHHPETTTPSAPPLLRASAPTAKQSKSEQHADSVARQLDALFGKSLFDAGDGGRVGGEAVWFAPLWRRGRRWWAWRATVVLGLALIAGWLVWLTSQADAQRYDASATDVTLLLRAGALDVLATHPPLLVEAVETEALRERHAALYARLEATLYRLWDASPQRRKKAEAALVWAHGAVGQDGVVAAAMLRSEAALSLSLESLRGFAGNDPVAAWLVARALQSRASSKDVEAALAQSEKLEPSNAVHGFFTAAYYQAVRRTTLARNYSEQLRNSHPTSAWSAVATALTADDAKSALVLLLQNTDMALPPVLRFEAWSALAELEGKQGNDAVARGHVAQAVAAVSAEPVFLVDLAERLARRGLPQLAAEIRRNAAWPAASPGAVLVQNAKDPPAPRKPKPRGVRRGRSRRH